MIIRILDKLSPCFDEVIIVLRDNIQRKKYLRVLGDRKNADRIIILTDIIQGQGPMGGILTGLSNIKSGGALVVPCDSPFITKEFIENSIKNFGKIGEYDVIAPVWGDGKIEPLHSIYSKRVVDKIKNLLLKNEKRVNVLIGTLKSKLVPVEQLDPSLQSFRNINKPRDLRI